jgi:hypothetical protein
MTSTDYDGYEPSDPHVRVDQGGWISGPSAGSHVTAEAAMELERAIDRASDYLANLDDLAGSRGASYALRGAESVLKSLIVVAERVLE